MYYTHSCGRENIFLFNNVRRNFKKKKRKENVILFVEQN